MRVRWAGVWKVAAVAVTLLIALQALPALLKPPEPPPLAADVGLPRAVPAPEEPPPPESRFEKHRIGAKGTSGSAVTDVISSKPGLRRRHKRDPTIKPPPPSAPPVPAPPAVESAPQAPPAAPAPTAAPAPPPTPPGDGSEEFAPH